MIEDNARAKAKETPNYQRIDEEIRNLSEVVDALTILRADVTGRAPEEEEGACACPMLSFPDVFENSPARINQKHCEISDLIDDIEKFLFNEDEPVAVKCNACEHDMHHMRIQFAVDELGSIVDEIRNLNARLCEIDYDRNPAKLTDVGQPMQTLHSVLISTDCVLHDIRMAALEGIENIRGVLLS